MTTSTGSSSGRRAPRCLAHWRQGLIGPAAEEGTLGADGPGTLDRLSQSDYPGFTPREPEGSPALGKEGDCTQVKWEVSDNVATWKQKEGSKMLESRMKVAPDTVAYADGENRKLVVEFAIPGAPADTVDLKILEDSVHLTAPARDIEYVSSLALGWPVKPDKAEATYQLGLLRIEVPFKDPMEDAVKVAIKTGGADIKTKGIEG